MGIDSFILDQFEKGGPLMWPLAVCSLTALTFAFERLWVLFRMPGDERAQEEMQAMVARVGHSHEELLSRLLERKGILAAVYASVQRKYMALLEEGHPSEERRSELAREADMACREYLGQFLPVLSTIGSIAPLLGLLGTITGMIKAFAAIALSGVGDPSRVADGISEALITTATGLIIAIPVIVLHRYLAIRAGRIMRRLELYTHAFGHALVEAEKP